MNTDAIPDIVSCTAQPLAWQGKLHQAITLSLGFDLIHGHLLAQDRAWGAAMHALEEMSAYDPSPLILDLGVPKREAEWLLIGKAYPAEQATEVLVTLRVGESMRAFLVASSSKSPQPLAWKATWGSPNENPKGLAPTQITRAPVTDKAAPFGTPACPAPRGHWPKPTGTYDAAWLKNRWPDAPNDYSWDFANLAQPAQRLPQGIRGDEAYTLMGVHPTHRQITGRLPGKSLELTVCRGEQRALHAVSCDTILFFPNEGVGMLLWHALVATKDESGSDIMLQARLLPEESVQETVQETMEEPPFEPPSQDVPVLVPAPPEPEIPIPPVPPLPTKPSLPTRAEWQSALDDTLPEINKGLAEAGLPPLTPAQIAQTRQKIDAMAEEIQTFAKASSTMPDTEPSIASVLHKAGISAEHTAKVEQAMALPKPDPSTFRTQAEWEAAVERYLAAFSAILRPSEGTIATMRQVLAFEGPDGKKLLENLAGDPTQKTIDTFVQAGMTPDAATRFVALLDEDIPADPAGMQAYATRLEQAGGFAPGSISGKVAGLAQQLATIPIPNARDLLKQAQKEAPPPMAVEMAAEAETEESPPEQDKVTDQAIDRETVIQWVEEGKSLAGLDLSGLSLEGVNLTQANLQGVMARETDFSNANLSGACLVGACVDGALFSKTDLSQCDASALSAIDAEFANANLSHAIVAHAKLRGAIFTHCEAEGCALQDSDLTETRLRFSHFAKACFARARLTGSDIHACTLDHADCSEAVFDHASLCAGTTLSAANFVHASLIDADISQVEGRNAQFRSITANGIRVSDSSMEGSCWRGSQLKEGDFSRTNLSHADMAGCDLFQGSLREANLVAANYTGASLYGVDMARAIRCETNFDGADTTNTILHAQKDAP